MKTKTSKHKECFCEEYEPKRKAELPPLTVEELKERLKHVAGLCYGLLCDIGSMEIETADLREKVLKFEAKEQGITPYELERRRELFRLEHGFEPLPPPLKSDEVKERLKRIAGECYAMNADIKDYEENAVFMREYIEELRAELFERKQICPKKCFYNKKAAFLEKGLQVAPIAPFNIEEEKKAQKKRIARKNRG